MTRHRITSAGRKEIHVSRYVLVETYQHPERGGLPFFVREADGTETPGYQITMLGESKLIHNDKSEAWIETDGDVLVYAR